MRVYIREATGPVLNWLVARCEGYGPDVYMRNIDIRKDVNGKIVGITVPVYRDYTWFSPSSDWSQGGPIIDREDIELVSAQGHHESAKIMAVWRNNVFGFGQTNLVAAMRCYVASKLGEEAEVPEEFQQ